MGDNDCYWDEHHDMYGNLIEESCDYDGPPLCVQDCEGICEIDDIGQIHQNKQMHQIDESTGEPPESMISLISLSQAIWTHTTPREAQPKPKVLG